MFSGEMVNTLIQVIKSWQVLAITVALIAFIFLINYVARTYRRPKFVSRSRPKKPKFKPAEKPKKKEGDESEDSNAALGLEE